MPQNIFLVPFARYYIFDETNWCYNVLLSLALSEYATNTEFSKITTKIRNSTNKANHRGYQIDHWNRIARQYELYTRSYSCYRTVCDYIIFFFARQVIFQLAAAVHGNSFWIGNGSNIRTFVNTIFATIRKLLFVIHSTQIGHPKGVRIWSVDYNDKQIRG